MGSHIFELEVGEVRCPIDSGAPRHWFCDASARDRLAALCSPLGPAALKVHRDVTQWVLEQPDDGALTMEEDRLSRLCRHLAARGHDTAVRVAMGGGGKDCFSALRHAFLVVRGSGDYTGVEVLVETALRQQFTVSHPTREYAEVLAAVPDVFVGGSCRLVPIVQLLCALMADSFQRQGLALPPWRREGAMLSKWLPCRSKEVPFVLQPASPSNGAPSASSADDAHGASAQLRGSPVSVLCNMCSWGSPRQATADPSLAVCGFELRASSAGKLERCFDACDTLMSTADLDAAFADGGLSGDQGSSPEKFAACSMRECFPSQAGAGLLASMLLALPQPMGGEQMTAADSGGYSPLCSAAAGAVQTLQPVHPRAPPIHVVRYASASEPHAAPAPVALVSVVES